jgi:hypothetical protein
MFTWICPNCGREVPPSYSECPNCAAKQKAASQVEETAAPPPAVSPQQPAPAVVIQPPPTVKAGSGLPTWLMSVLFAFLFIAVGVGIYWGVGYFRNRSQQPAATASFEAPAAPKADPTKPNPLQRFIEVTGLRLTQNAKKTTDARFVVVNHSSAEIADLAAVVTLRARSAKPEDPAAGTFAFKVASLGPYDSTEITVPLDTTLRVYELPDWQNLEADVRITSPQ